MAGIAHTLDTTLKVLSFFGCFTFGTQQMCNAQHQQYKPNSEDELDTYGKITKRII